MITLNTKQSSKKKLYLSMSRGGGGGRTTHGNLTVAWRIERFSYDLEKQISCMFVSCFICQSFLS